MYPVKATVTQIFGFSGHADRHDLLRWLSHLNEAPKRVFLTHGDEEAAESLAAHIREQLGWPVAIPEYQQVVELD
jgi:metallo-beta-lactamase family protein